MQIDTLVLGMYETNSYVLRADANSKTCIIIDTGLDVDPLLQFLTDENLQPESVILTHGHADHIVGLEELRKQFPDIKVIIHKIDAPMLTAETPNLAELIGMQFSTKPAEKTCEDGDTLNIAGIELQVLHTPGHTPGGICLYAKNENILFSGDTLFSGSIGRSDFPGGDHDDLIASIKNKLMSLPDNTKVYTGHGPSTNIGIEKQSNPFL